METPRRKRSREEIMIRRWLRQGVPLYKIERFLDWLENQKPPLATLAALPSRKPVGSTLDTSAPGVAPELPSCAIMMAVGRGRHLAEHPD